jgi:enoyl-CoA hydratase/carnithine racemase
MLNIIDHDGVIELAMDRPPVNALNQAFIDQMIKELGDSAKRGAKAVVLSGRDGFFSAGLDVPELLQLDRDAISAFWNSFFVLMNTMAALPVPVVAAITGHAPAGGAILALHADYRIAAQGDYKIGLNEVRVGLPVPRNIIGVLEYVVGARTATRMAVSGTLMSPDEALAIGLIDEVTANGETVARALEWLQEWLSLPPIAMNKTRLAAKSALLERATEITTYVRIATDYWFSDETQTMMKQLVADLEK